MTSLIWILKKKHTDRVGDSHLDMKESHWHTLCFSHTKRVCIIKYNWLFILYVHIKTRAQPVSIERNKVFVIQNSISYFLPSRLTIIMQQTICILSFLISVYSLSYIYTRSNHFSLVTPTMTIDWWRTKRKQNTLM